MNERIKELAEQNGFIHSWQPPGEQYDKLQALEKFAELIVRECIQVVDGMADPEEDSDRYVWALHNASEKIREHFGVK
jgi:hypothetical protein